jgi:hypothetical protein
MMLVVDKRFVVLEWKTSNPNVYIEDTVDFDTRIDLTRRLNKDVYDVVVEEIPDGVLKNLVHEKVTVLVVPTKATMVYYERTGKIPEFLFVENILGG